MKSYTALRNHFGKLANNASSANLTFGDELINTRYRRIVGLKDWPFLERLRTLSTVASTQFVNLPYDTGQVKSVAVIVSSLRYTTKESPSREHWDWLNLSTFTSDTPEWHFVYNGQLGLWPIPASSGNTININSKIRVIDLSVADYTTGNIVSIANGATAVVGSGTTWTAQMVGRFIRFTYSDTANTGDGEWYEISAVGSTTTMTLTRKYGGTSIAAGSAAYTIGQMPLLPEEYHSLPVTGAVADYWAVQENPERAKYYQDQYDVELAELVRTWSSPSTDMVIDNGQDQPLINPNLTISL